MSNTIREILFRGKRTDNGEWTTGYYVVVAAEIHYIFTGRVNIEQKCKINCECFEVDPETVGKYTNLTDKNGTKIFEGDIVTYDKEYGEEPREKGVVYWCDGSFWVENVRDEEDVGLLGVRANYQLEVIGNKHDNPELLEESRCIQGL